MKKKKEKEIDGFEVYWYEIVFVVVIAWLIYSIRYILEIFK